MSKQKIPQWVFNKIEGWVICHAITWFSVDEVSKWTMKEWCQFYERIPKR